MKNKRNVYLLVGSLVIIAIYFVVTYNSFVKKDEQVNLKWSEVQNSYQRRIDLIPNLVNVVKGGAAYEQTTLQQVVEARARAASMNVSGPLSAENFNRQSAAQDELAASANRLMATIERYPQLKGTRAFLDLQTQLVGTERRIKVARKNFNESIADYNSSVKGFPGNIVGKVLGFPPKEGFQSSQGADRSVEIKF